MFRISSVTVLLLALSALVSAQSGRRIATPSPTPAIAVTAVPSAPAYSESTPAPTRRPTLDERFPKLGRPVSSSGTTTQNPSQSTSETSEEGDTLKVATDLVTIPVSVFDRNGLYIPGLTKEDFSIFEDGKEQQIAYFGTSDKPFTVVLLLDTSPSTEFKIEEIQAAATAFVDQLKPNDQVIVIEFDGNIHVLTEATSDRQRIYKAIRKADFGNGTSLYDAVDYTLRKRLNRIEGKKAIVLFTDGVDTTSYKADYDSTVDEAEEADTMIFPIYYNTYFQNQRRTAGQWPGMGGVWSARGTNANDYAVGRKYLDELALYTGGRVFRPESTPGGLTAAFEGIAEELRRQYNIGYVPIDEGKPGQRKKIKVRVDRANLVIRARDSYIVGAAEPTPAATPVK